MTTWPFRNWFLSIGFWFLATGSWFLRPSLDSANNAAGDP